MKISNAVTIALLVAAKAGQAKPTTPLAPKVIICLEYGTDLSVTSRAQMIASEMFAKIGVATEWHGDHSCPARRDIVIRLRGDTPFDYRPGALAEAYPYEGAHIRVFYDRVQQSVHPRVVPNLLAHVLVHEVTHLLEGVNRHSESGVMKALWDEQNHVAMVSKPLPFAPEDVRLIHAGIERRFASRTAAVRAPSCKASANLEANAPVSGGGLVVIGATPAQEALLRAQVRVMDPDVLPSRIVFVPHWKYLDDTRVMHVPRLPTGYSSAMFTHLPSRTVFIDTGRYIDGGWLGYWMAHELGHLATNSVSEEDAEKAAKRFRKRLETAARTFGKDLEAVALTFSPSQNRPDPLPRQSTSPPAGE